MAEAPLQGDTEKLPSDIKKFPGDTEKLPGDTQKPSGDTNKLQIDTMTYKDVLKSKNKQVFDEDHSNEGFVRDILQMKVGFSMYGKGSVVALILSYPKPPVALTSMGLQIL
jgi:hypothetical protein